LGVCRDEICRKVFITLGSQHGQVRDTHRRLVVGGRLKRCAKKEEQAAQKIFTKIGKKERHCGEEPTTLIPDHKIEIIQQQSKQKSVINERAEPNAKTVA
jgi:hypothetical protein